MKDETGNLIATISIDEDEDVDNLPCWDEKLLPAGELSRLCVRQDLQCRGIGKEMMRYAFEVLKKQGKKGVHILVKTGHEVALSAYSSLGFKQVGECMLFDKTFVCMEMRL